MVSSAQNQMAIELMQFFPLIMSGGTLLLYLSFHNFEFGTLPALWAYPIYISIVLSVVNLLIPSRSINKAIFKIPNEELEKPIYKDVERNF